LKKLKEGTERVKVENLKVMVELPNVFVLNVDMKLHIKKGEPCVNAKCPKCNTVLEGAKKSKKTSREITLLSSLS